VLTSLRPLVHCKSDREVAVILQNTQVQGLLSFSVQAPVSNRFLCFWRFRAANVSPSDGTSCVRPFGGKPALKRCVLITGNTRCIDLDRCGTEYLCSEYQDEDPFAQLRSTGGCRVGTALLRPPLGDVKATGVRVSEGACLLNYGLNVRLKAALSCSGMNM